MELSQDENRFRITAYQKAADSIEHATSEIKDLWDDDALDTLAGVGESISSHLEELFSTGKVRHFEQILNEFPPALYELIKIPGLGPKSAIKLCKALGLNKAHTAIKKLQKAAMRDQVAKIEGFGADSQAAIIRSINEFQNRSRRLLLPDAQKTADEIISWLKKLPLVKSADPLGSLRRRVATVGDIDISVSSDYPKQVISHFIAYPKKRRVLESGDKTASIILPNDHQVDLMVQPPPAYGSLLVHFTGSKHHNIALREYAQKKGFSISEYGIKTKTGLKKYKTEEQFYDFLGLQYIPPELRENQGEIESAQKHQLPRLINLQDIKGDMQIHSSIDVQPSHDLGQSSVSQLANKARRLKYQYIGLTEHNPSIGNHNQRQIIDIIKMKTNIIHTFNNQSENQHENTPHVFNGLEIDIRPDGTRALPDAALDLLDYACVSIHNSFNLSRKEMTERIIRGLDHPKVKFFAHPTARLLLQREAIEIDWDKLFEFCLEKQKWIEINSWPNRLDLPDNLVREAVKRSVKLIINTDSHHVEDMDLMQYGVSVARRGWVEKESIVNTKSLTEMRQLMLS